MKDSTMTVKILKSFIDARALNAEEVMEKSAEGSINVQTYHQYDAQGNLLVEDVVVESRPNLF